MRYLFINSVAGFGSTGRIAADQCRKLQKEGHDCVLAYGRRKENCDDIGTYKIGTKADCYIHGIVTRIFDKHGFASGRATKRFLKWVDGYDPDVIWIHNIHGYYINIEMLFDYLKRARKKVIWTLHDCWSFTGHCPYFTYIKCEKWKTGCHHCGQKDRYPGSRLLDNSKDNFQRKKEAFCGVEDMTLIVPSQWLADLVGQSFLKGYPVEVRYNTIDRSIFRPTQSDFRERYGLTGKKVILGVANIWDERKGLDDFIRLAGMLDDGYAIVLVGLTQKQIDRMPVRIHGMKRVDKPDGLTTVYVAADSRIDMGRDEAFRKDAVGAEARGSGKVISEKTACGETINPMGGEVVEADVESVYKAITGRDHSGKGDGMKVAALICIQRTGNTEELARLYSMADLFVNLTHEDNYPTVNLEARACGTYVITYDTGGCRETMA